MSIVSDHAEIDTALVHPAVVPLMNAGFPLLLIGGEPPRVLWANAAAFALFGVANAGAVSARALGGPDPGAKRLQQVFASPPVGAARLERLRFLLDGRSEVLTWRCQYLAAPIALLVACALDWEPRRGLQSDGLAEGDTVASTSADSSQPPAAPPQQGEASPEPPNAAPGAVDQAPSGKDQVGPAEVRADLAARFPGARTVRFLWQTARDNRFTVLTGALCDAIGCSADDLLGADLMALADRLGLDPDGRLHSALSNRATWAKIEVLWPVARSQAALPVSLGAVPAFDRQREFDGWRGFGVVDLLRPQAHVSVSSAAPSHPGEAPRADPPSFEPTFAFGPVSMSLSPLSEPEAPGEPDIPSSRAAHHGDNVVALRPFPSLVRTPASEERPEPENGLSSSERLAFREIALALGARVQPEEETSAASLSPPLAAEPAEPRDAPASLAPSLGDKSVDSEPAPQDGEVAEPEAEDSEPAAASQPPGARAFLDLSPLGLMASRGDGALWLNRALLQMLGYDSEAQFQEAGGLARMLRGRALQELAQSATVGDMPVIDRAGNVSILECASHAIAWHSEPATLTVFRRIGDRVDVARVKTLEMELRRRDIEARELRSILDTATDEVALLDDRGRLLSLNRAGEALFGYDQNEVAGEPFTVLVANESHAPALDYFSQLATNGVASLLNDGREIIGRARRGGSIPVFMTLGPLNAGGAQKFCAVLRDLTAWKKVERDLNEAKREAERASALKSDFLAKVSHEIRTPLNAILGFAEVIMDERFGPVGNERYKEYLKDIHASGTHVMSLVNDLLDLSKIEAGKMELNFGSVDANKIVSECVSIMQPQANSERVIVRLSTTPRLPNVMADERSLRQIVLNLLSNAVKFNEPGGQVIVSTALTDAGHAVIRIRDTGIGMSDSELITALEPFRQVQTSRQTSGTGLGLPLTKALVEANKASFTVKSKKSEGTLVEVAFPPARVMAD